MIIKPLTLQEHQAFIENMDLVPVFYTPQWQSLTQSCFENPCQVLGIFDESVLKAIIPFTRLRVGKGIFKALVSQPLGAWGGIFPRMNIENQEVLYEYLKSTANADIFIFQSNPLSPPEYKFASVTDKNETLILDLNRDTDTIWQSFSSRRRNRIRLAEKKGIRIQLYTGDEPGKIARELYQQSIETRPQRNGLLYDRTFFENCFAILDKRVQLYTALYEDKTIAGALFYKGKNILHSSFAFGQREYYHLNAHSLIIWEVCCSCAQKYHYLDLGASRQIPSLLKFKEAFGPKSYPLYSYTVPLNMRGKCYHTMKNILGR